MASSCVDAARLNLARHDLLGGREPRLGTARGIRAMKPDLLFSRGLGRVQDPDWAVVHAPIRSFVRARARLFAKFGFCDSSPGRRATAHYRSTGHLTIRSAEPGESGSWCYVDELMFRVGH
jgi:hypothetical protein